MEYRLFTILRYKQLGITTSRIDKSTVESVVIDRFRNVRSKESVVALCSARSWSWGCEQSERRSSKEEKNEKTSGSTKLEVWTNCLK